MEVIVKRREGLEKNKGKMSTSERQGFIERLNELKVQKQDVSWDNIEDKGAIESEIKNLTERLHKDESLSASVEDKDYLAKRRDELASRIKLIYPSSRIQQAKEGTPEYSEAMRMGNIALRPENVDMCNEYKDICLRLEPDNPDAGSLSKIVGD